MARESYNALQLTCTVVVLLLVCRYSSAQGCSPTPPSTLISSGPPGALGNGNVPNIAASSPATFFRVAVGGQNTDPWAVFSETQIRQHGLWCQVQQSNTNNMTDNNIGDWYYPTPSGLLALDNINNDGTPYQELKCDNQVGLVVDGDIMNNQGIVRCTTNITGLTTFTGLSIDSNYLGVYEDSVITTIRNSGPVVEPNMRLTLLHTRDVGPSVQFRLSFNVSLGLPSRISSCTRDGTIIRDGRGFVLGVNYEVLRSQYISTSQPEIIRLSFDETRPSRMGATYSCNVFVEGRTNITSDAYNHDQLGSGTSTATVTVAGTPTGVTATRSGYYNSVLVSWTAPLPTPAGYEVFHQTTSDATRLSVGNTTSTMITVTGLTLGVTYFIFVVSFGAEGAPVLPSAHSNAPQITIPTQLPQLSGTPTLTPNTTSIMVSWNHPQYFPDNYTVSYSCQLLCDSQTQSVQTNAVTGTVNNHTISSLNAGSSCTVSVTAVFGSTNGNTITSSTNTLTAAPTGAPIGLTSTSVKSRSLSIVWETVPCPHQGGPITGYRLRYSNGTSIVNTTGEGNRQHVLTGLTPFTSYSVQVTAVNGGGTGPYSDPALTVETQQDVPGPVSNLSATAAVTQLTLLWSPPSELNGVIIVYEVHFSFNEISLPTVNTSATQHTLRDLPPNTVVTFSVRAYTIIGPGEYVTGQASTESFSQLKVRVLSLDILNSTSVRVSWTPVNLTVVYHYTVHYTTVGGVSSAVTFPDTVSSGVVSELQGGQQYQFSVTVTVNISGELVIGSPDDSIPLITLPMVAISTQELTTTSTATTDTSSSSGLLAVLVIGWILFAIVMVVCLSLLVWIIVLQRCSNNKTKSLSSPVALYEEPVQIKERDQIKMTECVAYSKTHTHTSDGVVYDDIDCM